MPPAPSSLRAPCQAGTAQPHPLREPPPSPAPREDLQGTEVGSGPRVFAPTSTLSRLEAGPGATPPPPKAPSLVEASVSPALGRAARPERVPVSSAGGHGPACGPHVVGRGLGRRWVVPARLGGLRRLPLAGTGGSALMPAWGTPRPPGPGAPAFSAPWGNRSNYQPGRWHQDCPKPEPPGEAQRLPPPAGPVMPFPALRGTVVSSWAIPPCPPPPAPPAVPAQGTLSPPTQ